MMLATRYKQRKSENFLPYGESYIKEHEVGINFMVLTLKSIKKRNILNSLAGLRAYKK